MVQHGHTWPHMVWNGLKWSEMVWNGLKRLKMFQIAPNVRIAVGLLCLMFKIWNHTLSSLHRWLTSKPVELCEPPADTAPQYGVCPGLRARGGRESRSAVGYRTGPSHFKLRWDIDVCFIHVYASVFLDNFPVYHSIFMFYQINRR